MSRFLGWYLETLKSTGKLITNTPARYSKKKHRNFKDTPQYTLEDLQADMDLYEAKQTQVVMKRIFKRQEALNA